MAQQDFSPLINRQAASQKKKRSALGVGVTTLVTIIVVVLLTAFSVLSLVSANSNLRLSQMAATQTQNYYVADTNATLWYADLDTFAAALTGDPSTFAGQLQQAGYQVITADDGELLVTNGFTVSDYRSLMVTVAINDDKTTTIRQWQS